ncbi:hypothetical protein K1T71_014390 [Dendrolimus kikuchii]|uniref:Uncharacterized protein n=1 Tax=Dendrolimus kikuchii TaxID=765133 RepID=A0ACC1CDX9_9NEOP|nr:hypothetical protein K1T71_014390 [Dendrolimus kikuchii]
MNLIRVFLCFILIGKAQQAKADQTTVRVQTTSSEKPATRFYTEAQYLERIEELQNAKEKYGTIDTMPSLTLRDGQEMPVFALGTATLDPRLLRYIIGAAIDLGYRAIDSGFIYGNEKEVGEAVKAKINDGTVTREELFIIGKLWSTYHRTDLVETACKASLDAMGLKYFDLYLIHNPMSFKEGPDPFPRIATVLQYSQYDYLDAWYGMETLVSKGLAKSIGVSNFNSVQIQRIMDKGKIKPSVNQVECHPYLSQQRLAQFCDERNIKLSCFGTLGSKGTPAEYKSSLPPVIDDALVRAMALGMKATAAQVLIKYQLLCERAVVVKSSSAAHLWDNLQATKLNMSSVEVDALHALNRNKRTFTLKGMGDTHKNYPFNIAF